MALTKGAADAAAIAKQSDYSDRDLLVAVLHAVCALADRLDGGPLVVRLESEKTGRAVDVHASPGGAGFVASVPEHSMPLQAALQAAGK